jgi:hypothetical protein
VAIPAPAKAGYVWRLARRVDPAVAVEVAEADVGRRVVVVFRTTGKGRATIAYGLTRGESPTAIRSVTYRLVVLPS